jgi:hypothetical protein
VDITCRAFNIFHSGELAEQQDNYSFKNKIEVKRVKRENKLKAKVAEGKDKVDAKVDDANCIAIERTNSVHAEDELRPEDLASQLGFF